MRRTALILTCVLAPASGAGAFQVLWPVDCVNGESCFVQNHVDRDPGPGVSDYTCGSLTYDGHKGTDIRLPTETDLDLPMQVRAAAAGTVTGIRDDMPDGALGSPGAPTVEDIAGRECGNGVRIDHGEGWATQYCHMARFSIEVGPGDKVEAGQVLGLMGLSGATEFPHLHFSVSLDGETVDPFAPAPDAACGDTSGSLWETTPAHVPGALLSVGTLDRVPDYAEVKRGLPLRDAAPADAALVLWAMAFGAREEDAFRFSVTGDGGTLFDRTVLLEKTQAQVFRAFGRRAPPEGWPPGRYDARIEFRREGDVLDSREFTLTLTE